MTDDKTTTQEESLFEFLGRVGEQIRTRRETMSNAAKAGAGGLALMAGGAGTAVANDGNDDNGNNGDNSDDGSSGSDADLSDIDILNYALTLEHLEAAYYNEFLDEYSESEVENSEVAQYFARPTLRYSVYQQIQDVRDHEEAHVEALTATIKKLGGTPVEPAEYEFPYETMEDFVALSDRIEAVGVSAYAGVGPFIDNLEVAQAALSIHSVEANHQTYFQLLHLQRPAPNAFNMARSTAQVLPIAKQFIVGAGGGGSGGDDDQPTVIRQTTVQLSGENEVPPVDTDASGEAMLKLVEADSGPQLQYELSVMNIEDVTQAHIHTGQADENGPVVAFLFGPNESGVSEDGVLASGTITESDLVGPLEGETFEELKTMTDEGAYVNVHTKEYPEGELRGQVNPE